MSILVAPEGGIDQTQFVRVDQRRRVADDRVVHDAPPEARRARSASVRISPIMSTRASHVEALLAGDGGGLQRHFDDHADERRRCRARMRRQRPTVARSARRSGLHRPCGRPMLARDPLTPITTPLPGSAVASAPLCSNLRPQMRRPPGRDRAVADLTCTTPCVPIIGGIAVNGILEISKCWSAPLDVNTTTSVAVRPSRRAGTATSLALRPRLAYKPPAAPTPLEARGKTAKLKELSDGRNITSSRRRFARRWARGPPDRFVVRA